ncbi:hypothetical protein HMPREF2803_07785, partial [Staphylococcus sp. HMSC034D07]
MTYSLERLRNDMNIKLIKEKIDNENKRMGSELEYTFKYKGHKCKVKRIEEYGHLCGYIYLNVKRGSEEYEIIDELAHCGVSYHKGNLIGFDCAHAGDFSLRMYNLFENKTYLSDLETYKDLEYVENNIKEIIDSLQKGG